jgi:hypothetical protein
MGLFMTRLLRTGDKHSTPDAVHHLPRLRPKYDARKRMADVRKRDRTANRVAADHFRSGYPM